MKVQDRMRFSSSSFFSVKIIYTCLHKCGSPVIICLSVAKACAFCCLHLRRGTAHVPWGVRGDLPVPFLSVLEMAVHLYLCPPFSEWYVSQHQVHVCYMYAE